MIRRRAAFAALMLITVAHAAVAPGTYAVDSKKSTVRFRVNNFGFVTVEGQFRDFRGTLTVDKNFAQSKFAGSAKATSIDTDNKKRDTHLRSEDFFAVEKFPTLEFKSTELKGDEKSFTLTGDLTIKGKTVRTTFDCKQITDEKIPANTFAFNAQTKIKRADYGITSYATIDKTIRLNLKIYATK